MAESGDHWCSPAYMVAAGEKPVEGTRRPTEAAWGRVMRQLPARAGLDTLDTTIPADTVHGISSYRCQRPLRERCFLQIPHHDAASGNRVAEDPARGQDAVRRTKRVRTVLKHVIKRIRRHWPRSTPGAWRQPYGRDEAWSGCEKTQASTTFWLRRHDVLDASEAREAATRSRATSRSGAKTGARSRPFATAQRAVGQERRFVARTRQSERAEWRYLGSSPRSSGATNLYGDPLCARGNAEKLHQDAQEPAAFDRTSCRDPKAKHVPPDPATKPPPYWLMLAMRSASLPTRCSCPTQSRHDALRLIKTLRASWRVPPAPVICPRHAPIALSSAHSPEGYEPQEHKPAERRRDRGLRRKPTTKQNQIGAAASPSADALAATRRPGKSRGERSHLRYLGE